MTQTFNDPEWWKKRFKNYQSSTSTSSSSSSSTNSFSKEVVDINSYPAHQGGLISEILKVGNDFAQIVFPGDFVAKILLVAVGTMLGFGGKSIAHTCCKIINRGWPTE